MTRFKQHAAKVKEGGQGIMDRYLAALKAKQGAHAALQALERRNHPGALNRPGYRELADAQEAYETASRAYSETVTACKVDSRKLAEEGREGLQKAVDAFYAVDSDKFDAAYAALADSGIIEEGDILAAFEKYADNGTMLRYVAKQAEERVKAGTASSALVDAYTEYRDGYSPEAVMANYDALARTLSRFTCSDYSAHWDTQAAPMVDAF